MKRIANAFGLALSLVVATACLFSSCSGEVGNSEGQDGATLTITIPTRASWIPATDGDLSPDAGRQRALALADSVKVDILDGANRIYTKTVALVPSWGPAGVPYATVATIGNIPAVGTGFSVTVSVYNHYTSETDPVVSRTVTGVSFQKDGRTDLSITCIPVNPVVLTVDVPETVNLTSYQEKWYAVPVTKGIVYSVNETGFSRIFALFDEGGTYISSHGYSRSYTATYTGTLYVCVYQQLTSNPIMDSRLTIGTSAIPLCEGTQSSPVSLSVDAIHAFKIGPSLPDTASYYSVTLPSAGDYALALPSPAVYAYGLFRDAGFTDRVTGGSTWSGFVAPLAAGTYYLRLEGMEYSDIISESGSILTLATHRTSDGLMSFPAAVTIGVPKACSIARSPWYDNAGYYSFMTGVSDLDYSLTLTGISSHGDIECELSTSPDFSSPFIYWYPQDSVQTPVTLSPNTTYYLKILNTEDSAVHFSLTLATYAQPITDIAIGTSWTNGTIAKAWERAWYRARVQAGHKYVVSMADSQDRGELTLDAELSCFRSDRLTPYFADADRAYSLPYIATVPTGESVLFLEVQSRYWYHGYSGGSFQVRIVDVTP